MNTPNITSDIEREAVFKAELAALCERHGVGLKSCYDVHTDTAIFAYFNDCHSFKIDESD